MRIFITGATGFIGRAFCRVAAERGHRLLALCRSANPKLSPEIEIANGSLITTPWLQVKRFKPDAVLHLAWVATPGLYLTSPENEVWLEQSKTWFQQLLDTGRPHIAGTGTCIEYATSALPLNEETSPLAPNFPYSRAKASLFEWLHSVSNELAPWSWFRVFYPYGPGEDPNRLCSSLIRQLSTGQTLSLRTPHSVKDYIFIDDLALAMCQALEVNLTGGINLGTGRGLSIYDLATNIAKLLQVDTSLIQQAVSQGYDPTPIVIADNRRLLSIGWSQKVSMNAGLQQLIHASSAHSG